MWWRATRWRPARTALWQLLDRHVGDGAVVAVIGAGNAHDVPLRQLCRRARRVDLIDLDASALRRARARAPRRGRPHAIVEDATLGVADTVTHAALSGQPMRHALPPREPVGKAPYDIVVADLLFTQLLYPALADAGLDGGAIDDAPLRHGQALTDAVVARLHASAPGGLVVHVHDLLAWWPGHPQPFALDQVLGLAHHDPQAALELAQRGNVPYGCDPRQASLRLGGDIVETAFWRWPFCPGVEYLIYATVARTRSVPTPAALRRRDDRASPRIARHSG